MSGISFVLKGSQSFSAYSTTDPLSSRSCLGGRALVLTVIVSVLNLERMTFEVSFGGS